MNTLFEKEINDDSSSKTGLRYEDLVALYFYFVENIAFENLVLSIKGDVTFDNNIQIESKHHKTDEKLTDLKDDFWNTLFNWLYTNENYQRYILFTTHSLSEDTILNVFKNKGKDKFGTIQKFIKNESKRKSIEKKKTNFFEYYNKNINRTREIINKIEIYDNQPTFDLLIKKIAKSNTFLTHFEKEIDAIEFINYTYVGYLQGRVTDNEKPKQITCNQFLNILRNKIQLYKENKYLPIYEKVKRQVPTELEKNNYSQRKFIQELEKIKCTKSELDKAILTFWQNQVFIAESNIDDDNFFIDDIYKPYRENVHYKLVHEQNSYYFEKSEWELFKIGKGFYLKALTLDFTESQYIKNQFTFVKEGTMHDIVQDDNSEKFNFHWLKIDL